MKFSLPWPPSINGYWRNFKGRQILSKKAREYRKEVLEMLDECECLSSRLSVRIDLYPPDKRKRDIDNHVKAILDSMVHAGIIEDDSLIDRLVVERQEIVKGGLAVVDVDKLREAGL